MARNATTGTIAVIPVCVVALVATLLVPSSRFPQNATAPSDEVPSGRGDLRETSAVVIAEPGSGVTYRGRIVTEDGSPLPPDLRLWRRVSYESTQETPVDEDGAFSFQTDSIRKSVRFSITGSGFAPFDSKWLKLYEPLELTLARGAKVQLRLVTPDGTGPRTGSASLSVPWWDNFEQGTFPVDENGLVTIAHCPLTTVNFDFLVPGFEYVRVRRLLQGDLTVEVPLQPARVTHFRVVSAMDGRPVPGAVIRFYSRTRAGSYLMPSRSYGDGPVWGESYADGRVELTTLCDIDLVPTNDPGTASYCFRIDAAG